MNIILNIILIIDINHNNGKKCLTQPKEVKEFKKFLEMVKVNKSKDAKTKAPKRSKNV